MKPIRTCLYVAMMNLALLVVAVLLLRYAPWYLPLLADGGAPLWALWVIVYGSMALSVVATAAFMVAVITMVILDARLVRYEG